MILPKMRRTAVEMDFLLKLKRRWFPKRFTAYMGHSAFQLPTGQGRQMDQSDGDSHRIHLPHQGTDPFFILEDIGEIRELACGWRNGSAGTAPWAWCRCRNRQMYYRCAYSP